jgi:F-type H+-transporting ATPase subunit b
MDEREMRMAKALEDAETQKKNAQNERLSFEKKSQQLEEEKERVLNSAARQAEQERKKMVSAAREEVARLEAQWRDAIGHEKKMLLNELRRRIQNEVFTISRRALSDLAGVKLETCIVDHFTERLKSLEPSEKDRLAAPLRNSSSAIVTSTFELSDTSKRQIKEAIRQGLDVAAEVQFVTAPELIAGIEFTTQGHKIAWTIQEYLSSLERELEKVSQEQEFARAG